MASPPRLLPTNLSCLRYIILTSPLQNAANYVSETVQGGGAEASKEANKTVAKDSDASLSSRATAAKDAVIDKKDESSHNTKADVHKGMSTSPSPHFDLHTLIYSAEAAKH